jgi:hypothetical protein
VPIGGGQLEDFDLPVGEFRKRPGGAAACRGGGEEGEGPGGDAGAEHDLARRHCREGPDDLVPFGPFDQVAVGAVFGALGVVDIRCSRVATVLQA